MTDGGEWVRVIEGGQGLKVSDHMAECFKIDLTRQPRVFNEDNPVDPIGFYEDTDEYLWVPRFYNHESFLRDDYAIEDYTTRGMVCDLKPLMHPREERGQVEAVDNMVTHLHDHKGGVLVAYTGCGKTIMGYLIAAKFKCAIGVMVYNSHMMKNWVDNAVAVFGLEEDDIGIVQGDRCDLGKPVTIMMVQSLYSRTYPDELYQQIGFILADEVNRYGAPVWQSVLMLFTARYRMGMSADPNRSDGLEDVVYWNFGEIGHTIPEVEKKAKPKILMVLYKITYALRKYITPYGSRRGEPDPMKYRKVIAEDLGRNAVIVAEILKAVKAKRKILVFSAFRFHCEDLKAALPPELNSSLLIGGVKDIDTAMSADIIFSTYSYARDAINLPHIDTLFFATPPGNPLQPVGRLRDVGPSKQPLVVVDFYENTPYSMDRANRRCQWYDERDLEIEEFTRNKRPESDIKPKKRPKKKKKGTRKKKAR